MTAKKQAPILGRAMLVKAHVSIWVARKHDKKVTTKVNDEMAHTPHAGRYHKRLFGGSAPEHSALLTASQVVRNMHDKQTLPWDNEGWRLLPTANYFQYTEEMRKVTARFEDALEAFIRAYPDLVRHARDHLGAMYKQDDYPHLSEVRAKFNVELQYTPLPTGDDFRVSLPKEELAAMAHSIEERVTQTVADAMNEAWTRLGDVVSKLRPKLEDGKHLRGTLIQRVGEVAEILGRLNLTEDPALETTRKQVLRDLATLDVDTLRDNEQAREDAAAKADKILKAMAGVYTPAA